MLNFAYQNPTKISFGKGCIAEIAAQIPRGSKVMITYGGGSIKRNGTLDEVKTALKGYNVSEFGGIEPNPTYETLMKCVELIHSDKIDFLLAVGGGSVIDGTKFIAAAALYEGEPWDMMLNGGANIAQVMPLGAVLTLPATSSEMNPTAVITRSSLKAKLVLANPKLYPCFSALDPTKTYTLPATQTGNGVVDTFIHVMEQYLTYPVDAKVQDRFAEGLLLTLIEDGPKALQEPENYDVRANLMWCGTLGLNGLIGVGVPQDWATHMIGHEITALYGMDHAKTLAIVLPSLLQVCKEGKRQKLLQYAERVWGLTEGDEDARIDAAINKTREFFESMQIKTHFNDYGINADCIPALLKQLKDHRMVKLGEREDITPEVVQKILEISL